MDARAAMFKAVRARLVGSATMVGMVASSSITVSFQRPATTYPAIRMRVVGGAGDNLPSFIAGDIYMNIYTKNRNPPAHLASIYDIARGLIHDKEAEITTSNIGIGRIREQYVDYPLFEEDARAFYLASRYSFTAQKRTRKVVNCDGQYYAYAEDATVHDVTTEDISFSAWVLVPEDHDSQGMIVWKQATNLLYESYGWYLGVKADGTIVARCIYGATFGGWSLTLTGATDISDGLWHPVSVVFDRSGATNSKVFLDGVDDTDTRTGSIGANSITNGAALSLGCSRYPTPGGGSPTWTLGNYFDGRICDVKLYIAADDIWSDAQIAYQAANVFDYSASPGTMGTITEYWQCTAGLGTRIQGSADNPLTLTNGAAWVEDSPP